jgi:hypothetical protein
MSASQTITDTAQRGARWLLGSVRADGSIEGATSLGDYYKAPFALTVTGHLPAAERVLGHVARKLLRPGGELDGTSLPWFDTFCIYPHAWLTVAALMRGRFELAQPLLRVLLECHDEKTGAFFGTTLGRRQRNGPQEVMSSSMAALACLWAGRLDVALRTGQWLRRLFDAQPDLRRGLYFVWDSAAGLVTEFPEAAAKEYFVDGREVTQWYFQYGISAAFLSSLSAATGDRDWLELAQRFLRASRSCREDVYRQPQSGKIGWGAAWTYRLSGDAEDRQLVETVAEGLLALQNSAGWWSVLGAYDMETATKIAPNLDVTSEFVGLLGCMELALV